MFLDRIKFAAALAVASAAVVAVSIAFFGIIGIAEGQPDCVCSQWLMSAVRFLMKG